MGAESGRKSSPSQSLTSPADAREHPAWARGVYAAFFSDQTHKISAVPDGKATMVAVPDYEEQLIAEIGDSSLLLPYLAFWLPLVLVRSAW